MDELAALVEQLLAASTPEERQEALSLIDLDATEAAIQTAASQVLASDDESADTLETLASLADAVEVIRAERARREAASAERTDALADITARLSGSEASAAVPVEAVAEETLAVDGGDGDDDAPDGGDTDDGDDTTPAESPAPAPEVEVQVQVPAPARPSLAALRGLQPSDAQPQEADAPRVEVRAAADVPGFPVGAEYREMRELAAALISRQEVLGRGRSGSISMEKVPVVHFSYIDSLRQLGDDKMLNGLALRDAGEPNALTAAGGFCAPAEIVYDFVKINRPTDLTQDFLPTVGVPRGSIEYPDSPDIRDAFTVNPSRPYTNAEDIAGAEKVTVVVDCPSFNTCTVQAQYVILQFGNFGTRAYPEWVQHWVGLSMDVHAHKVSEKLINQMVSLSNAAVAVGPNAGATGTLLSNFDMAAADFRHDLRMGKDAPLEVVVPSWTNDLIRSDMARARKGGLETLSITDGQIASWFSARRITPHYVTDWQAISGSATTGTSVWPSGLNFLIYPPGTFVRLDQGTLDLGVVRDSVLNATNDYNIFVETFESVCKPGIESRLYSVSICANGAFSADQNLSCAGIDIPGS